MKQMRKSSQNGCSAAQLGASTCVHRASSCWSWRAFNVILGRRGVCGWCYCRYVDCGVCIGCFSCGRCFLPVSEAVEKIPQYRNSLERLSGVVGEEQNIVSEQASVVDVLPQAIKSAHIQLENVGYRYGSDDNWSVRDLSLDIPQGKKLPSSAVVGQGNRRC